MKLFITILLLSSGFIPAYFHPIDDVISFELTDLTKSSDEISETSLEDKEKSYDGDLVMVTVENTGNFSEHIRFQVYFPDQANLLHFKSESSGPRGNPENKMTAKSFPFENADNDEEVNVYEMQTASTRSKLKSGNEISYSFNYELESVESKQTNQFLAILDIFSDNPETLKINFSSANFGFGEYPDVSKHRWLIRTRAGYSLSIDVKEVELEKDLDTLTVYDVQSSGEKKVLSEVSVAKQFETFSNRVLVLFKSDCSVNRGGFTAVVNISKNKRNKCETPENLENGYFVVSDANEKTNVTYYCNDNYVMIGDVTALTCFDNSFKPSLLNSNIRCVPEATTVYTAQTPEIFTTVTTEAQTPEISTTATTTTAQTPEIFTTATTQKTLKYRLELVKQHMNREAARKYCQDSKGDLIQKDQRLLTKSGRFEISQQLQMPFDNWYHTGIRRSETNKNIWIRSADGVQVDLSGWHSNGFPSSNDSWDFLYWYLGNDSNKNTIFNQRSHSWYFICEY